MKHQWKYKESFLIAFIILIIGFIIEYAFGKENGLFAPSWPLNLIFIILFLTYIIVTYNLFRDYLAIKWISSMPAAISSISIFTILVLMIGFIPQNVTSPIELINKLGLNRIIRSWPYIFCSAYLLAILGYTIIKRIYPFNLRNFAFFLNHAGLWLVVVSASLGSSDVMKLSMPVYEGEKTDVVFDENNVAYKMPFSIELIDFHIDEYRPELFLINKNSDIIPSDMKDKGFYMDEKVSSKTINGWNILVEHFMEESVYVDSNYIPDKTSGSVSSAFVKVSNKDTIIYGWVSSGSYKYSPQALKLSDTLLLAMTIPSAKKYSSEIIITDADRIKKNAKIEVNKPYSINGWTIYQLSYDEKMGKWSRLSVFELVRDPWIVVVYVGIFMLLAGSLFMLWYGKIKVK